MNNLALESILETFDIYFIVAADIDSGEVIRLGDENELEKNSLVSSLVSDIEAIKALNESVEGKRLPQMWGQGSVECIVCKPESNIIVSLFTNQHRDTVEAYQWNKEVNQSLVECWSKK